MSQDDFYDELYHDLCSKEVAEYYHSLDRNEVVAEIIQLKKYLILCHKLLQVDSEHYLNSELQQKVREYIGADDEDEPD